MWSIAQILKINKKNGQNHRRGEKKCPGFTELQKYHGTTIQRSFKFLKHYIESKKVIYKEHILPIKKHIQHIDKINKPVVVLLRKPEETVLSYKRIFDVINLEVNFDNLLEEVNLFYDSYINRSGIYLVITWRDLVQDFHGTMKKITKHYGFNIDLKIIKRYTLARRNYTGDGLHVLLEALNDQ
jgi:hypothetical protein